MQQLAVETNEAHGDLQAFDHVSVQQLQYDLENFRLRMAYFPFLHLPEYVTAQQLSESSALLMASIYIVASEAPGSEKFKLSNAYMHFLSSLALTCKADSLDLTQAYLVWLAWYHQNFHGIHTFGLCVSYCDGILSGALMEDEQPIKRSQGSKHKSPSRTSAIHRAFIGIAYMRACLQMLGNDRLNANIDWDELEDIAALLAAQRETASDESLPHLIRLCRRVGDLAVLGKRASRRRQGAEPDDASAIAAIAEKLHAQTIPDRLAASCPLLQQLRDFLEISILSATIKATPCSAQREASLVHPLVYRTCQRIDNVLLHTFARGSLGLQQLTVVAWAQMVGVVNLFDRLAWHTPYMPSSSEGYNIKELLLARLDSLTGLCESARQQGPGIDPQDSTAINWLALICHNLKARQEDDKRPDTTSGEQTSLAAVQAAAEYVPEKKAAHASQRAWDAAHPEVDSGNTTNMAANNAVDNTVSSELPPSLAFTNQPDDMSFLVGPDLFDWSNIFSQGAFNFPSFPDFPI